MADYDLNVFSPNEFEEFSRDLLQEKLNVFIESFKTGKDGGIDLRYSTTRKANVIIQAKRYKSISTLINNLKKEVTKVHNLKPTNYVITTTVSLSPHNKAIIKDLFKPFIKSTEDILGRDDLLNLLSQHSNIEEKYYKLWITSTTILEKVLHSKIYNQSQFELDEIKSQIKLYVQNKSFIEARKILDTHRYIVISGIPGIGKTTLARILTFYLLSNGYEEFVYLSDKIDDGYTYFKENKKQIFLFDDFLGRNFFDAVNLQKNDDKIIKFINKIKTSPDKVLILATREYILNQAKEVYEAFKIHDIEIAKCILDLSTYTNIIKAKILYNHLFHGEIPEEYINDIIRNKNYKTLINHKNYSPRIIETFIQQRIWNKCQPNEFFKVIKTLFDNPESVWLHSFENSLDKFSQYVLLVLLTLGTPVFLIDLEKAVISFFQKNNYKILLNYDTMIFSKSIRELENTFIKINADYNGKITIDYQNPSIYDFLVNYLRDKEIIISDLIKSFIFIDQFQSIFSGKKSFGKINLNDNLIHKISSRLLELESKLNTCKIYRSTTNDKNEFKVNNDYTYSFLNYLNKNFCNKNQIIKDFVIRTFKPNISFNYSVHKKDYIDLLESLDLTEFDFEEEKIIDSIYCYSYWIDDLELFENFKFIFPVTYRKWIESSHFKSVAEEIIYREMKNISMEDASDYKSKLETINNAYTLNLSEHFEKLDDLEQQHDSYVEHQINMYSDRELDNFNHEEINEEFIIAEIFNSLKE